MSTPAWGRALAAAISLAFFAPAGTAEEPLPPPTVELELSAALEIPPALPSMPAGADALDRLLAPTLIPLPGIESFDWFAEAPTSAGGSPCCVPCPAPQQCPPSFGGSLCCRPRLFGDVCGLRPRLVERGINFDIYSTNFYSQVFNGGLQETAQYRGRLDMLLNIDGEKAGLWKGSFIDLHGESIWGNTINQYTGTIMPVSIAQLVPVPNGSVTALTGVKFTQALSEQLMVFGGKLNLLDGFNQPFTGGARGVDGFWNGGLLFNPVLIRTVPYSTYGFGAAVLRNLEPVFTFLVLDANNTPTTTGFNSFFADGVVLVPQINIPTRFLGMPGHQGLIGSWSSKKYTNLDRSAYLNVLEGAPASTVRTGGAWSLGYMFDQALYVSPTDPRRMWGAFGNLGIADDNPSAVRWFANIGIGGSSPIEGRRLDTFGLGYYYAGLSGSIKSLAPALLPLRDEHGLEAFYNIGVTPWCRITPDVQFILPANDNAQHMWFFGLRAKVLF
jgi:porin